MSFQEYSPKLYHRNYSSPNSCPFTTPTQRIHHTCQMTSLSVNLCIAFVSTHSNPYPFSVSLFCRESCFNLSPFRTLSDQYFLHVEPHCSLTEAHRWLPKAYPSQLGMALWSHLTIGLKGGGSTLSERKHRKPHEILQGDKGQLTPIARLYIS